MNYLFTYYFVIAPPEFTAKPEDAKVALNAAATFSCKAKGNPVPSLFWSREGSQLLMFPGKLIV